MSKPVNKSNYIRQFRPVHNLLGHLAELRADHTYEYDFKKYYPIYGLFRRYKETGEIEGFSKGCFTSETDWNKNYVRTLRLSSAEFYKNFENHLKDYVKYDYFVYRISRKSSKRFIIADWKEQMKVKTCKRNSATFRTMKFSVNYQSDPKKQKSLTSI